MCFLETTSDCGSDRMDCLPWALWQSPTFSSYLCRQAVPNPAVCFWQVSSTVVFLPWCVWINLTGLGTIWVGDNHFSASCCSPVSFVRGCLLGGLLVTLALQRWPVACELSWIFSVEEAEESHPAYLWATQQVLFTHAKHNAVHMPLLGTVSCFRCLGKEHKKQGGNKGVLLSARQLAASCDRKCIWMTVLKPLICLDCTVGHQKILPGIPGFYYCIFVCNFYSELIRCRFVHLGYNSEQEMLLINYTTLSFKNCWHA